MYEIKWYQKFKKKDKNMAKETIEEIIKCIATAVTAILTIIKLLKGSNV